MGKDWDANIESARESKSENLSSPGSDGNREYDSGTYGQKDYTVRERTDGSYDVYVKSDSNKHHSHDRVDKDGNLLENYHDYLLSRLSILTNDELEYVLFASNNDCVKEVINLLKQSSTEKVLCKKR